MSTVMLWCTRINTSVCFFLLASAGYFILKSERSTTTISSRFILQQYTAFIGFFLMVICRDILLSFPWMRGKEIVFFLFSFSFLPISISIFRTVVWPQSKSPLWKVVKDNLKNERTKDTFLSIYDSIFFRSNIGLSLMDTNGRVLDANPIFESILGISRKELIGKKFTDFTHADDVSNSIARFQNMVQKRQEAYVIEKRYLHKNQSTIWVRLSVIHFFDQRIQEYRVLKLVENITQRKEAETRQIKHLEDMESIQHATSHQIRSPLGAIAKKMSRLLRNYPELDQEIATTVQESKELAISIGELLDSLPREFHSTQKQSSCLLSESLALSINRLGEIIHERNAHVFYEEECKQWGRLQIDLMTLTNILQILIHNAILYVPSNRNPSVRISCFQSEESQEIRVSDNGVGIDPQYWESIFTGSYRSHPEIGGDGIGLSLARRLISNFDGSLKVNSSFRSKGTTFLLTIPQKKDTGHEISSRLTGRR